MVLPWVTPSSDKGNGDLLKVVLGKDIDRVPTITKAQSISLKQ